MIVYVLTNYANGEDFSGNTEVSVFADLEIAKKNFENEVEEWKKYASENSEEDQYTFGEKTVFEITDFDNDFYAAVKLIKKEVIE